MSARSSLWPSCSRSPQPEEAIGRVDQARNVERDVDRSLDLAFSRAHISGLGDRISLAKLLTISPINRPKTMLLCDMPASRGADTNASFRKEVQGNERAEIPNVRISAGVSQPDVLKTCSSSRLTSLSFRLPFDRRLVACRKPRQGRAPEPSPPSRQARWQAYR